MKKAVKDSGSSGGFKTVLPRKKKRGGTLEDSFSGEKVVPNTQSSHLWESEAGNTTELDSINIEKKCLVEETSFDYGDNRASTGRDPN
ncbi:hypothetical protein G9A89_013406 [Geosiphon pyriformis]|nr:hypothetical protein G9A89_013406 [Geosiphon pyriformis]